MAVLSLVGGHRGPESQRPFLVLGARSVESGVACTGRQIPPAAACEGTQLMRESVVLDVGAGVLRGVCEAFLETGYFNKENPGWSAVSAHR